MGFALLFGQKQAIRRRTVLYSALSLCTLSFRHSVFQVRVTVQLSRKSWRTCVRPRRSWRSRERKERRRFDAAGDCQPALTLSAEVAALYSEFMQLIKFITSRTLSDTFLYIFLVAWRSCHMVLMPTNRRTCLPWTYLCRLRCQLWFNVHTVAPVSFLITVFLVNILTNFNSNHFNWKMGNVKKSWVCDQKGILTFFTTKKKARSYNYTKSVFRSNVVVADHAHIYLWKSNVYCFVSILYFC